MKVKANAKLNLSLNVFKKCGEFHPIDSAVVSVDVFDTVEVLPRKDFAVTVSGVDVPQELNTAYKAASMFADVFKTNGCDISIIKDIPFGAGLGGSSADAAATVYCLCKLYGIDLFSDKVSKICSSVGSDVNFMLTGGLGRMTGRGEKTEFFTLQAPVFFTVTFFDKQLSTGEVYAAFDKVSSVSRYSDNGKLIYLLSKRRIAEAEKEMSNFLEDAAKSISDYAKEYLSFCESKKISPHLTGSGSAYFTVHSKLDDASKVCRAFENAGFYSLVCRDSSCSVTEII